MTVSTIGPDMAKHHTPFRDVAKRAAEKHDDRTLAGLRKRQGMTQVEVAEALGISQASVADRESRSDAYVSTLREYVEALGGSLELVARFGTKRIVIDLGGAGS